MMLMTWGTVRAATESTLHAAWRFRLLPGTTAAYDHPQAAQWHPAKVPGMVQTDLLAAGLIDNPDVRDHQAELQWIGLADWQYRTRFKVDAATRRHDHVELLFRGLDTFAEVRLNGHKLLDADNMFRHWRVDARPWLREGDNTLTVTLHSPIAALQPWLQDQPHVLPGEFDSAFGDEPEGRQSANYVRKAAYQYGWDWGPRYVTEGIWKPVVLQAWNDLRLSDFHVAQPHVDAKVAHLRADFQLRSDHAGKAHLDVAWTAPDGRHGKVARDVVLRKGRHTYAVPLSIEQPQRWWPAGYGKQNLYRFHGRVSRDGKVLARIDTRTGLRSVEFDQQRDQWGHRFALVVNDVPVFAKGANVIPPDMFPNRVTHGRLAHMLTSARDVNMNMLRIWGGGYYLDDDFYTLADKLGILIWQDFMFGGAIPPYDKAFADNTRIEAAQQVRRLRGHPSIVVWAGNNEVQGSWQNWEDRQAFKKTISDSERQRIVAGMHTLFDHVLRDVVTQLEPEVPYRASSPGSDYGTAFNATDNGDSHYWAVWSGGAPIGKYLSVTPRFASEYGLQALPSLHTIKAFTRPGDRSLDSKVMRAHQRFAGGNERLMHYIRRYYGEPKDFVATVYLSQVMQAEGIQLAAEHLRASRPHAMGSLYWQLNDVWPGITWSSIDYHGRWKALQYHARRFYAPVRVVAIRHDGKTRVHVVSDRTRPFDATLRMRVMGMDGKLARQSEQVIHVDDLASVDAGTHDDVALLGGADPAHAFAVFDLIRDGKRVSRHLVYFDKAKNLDLPDPGLEATLSADGKRVTVHANKLARAVWIDFGDHDAQLSDNAFDLLPGESVTLAVDSKATASALRAGLSVRSLYGATK